MANTITLSDGTVLDLSAVAAIANNVQMQGLVKPTGYEHKPLFTKVSASSISVPANTAVRVGTSLLKVASATTLSVNTNLDTGTKVAGTDYYVYMLSTGSLILSASATAPSGYTTATSTLIGGFHYGLVGESEAATGNKTTTDMTNIQGINSYTFWDMKFRPTCNPAGMFFAGGKWFDIYLCNSEHITNGTSKAGATIAGGAVDTALRAIPKIPTIFGGNGTVTYGSLTWYQANEIGRAYGKRLITEDEFYAIAYGVVENTSSSTNSLETTAGKVEHYPTLTSVFGMEQATGVQWIWGANTSDGYNTDNSFAWANNTGSRGQIYATSNNPTGVLLGGSRGDGVYAGSRASARNNVVWYSSSGIGARFACDHISNL